MRIIADHVKASVFIIADGVLPSNTGQGYVLRRLIRRAVHFGRGKKIKNLCRKVAEPVFKIYEDYPELKANKKKILEELDSVLSVLVVSHEPPPRFALRHNYIEPLDSREGL